MTILTPIAVSGAPLLRAIQSGGDLSAKGLAEASGKSAKNISRDLAVLEKAELITREPGSPPALTADGVAVLAELDGGATTAPAPLPGGMVELLHEQIWPDSLNPRQFVPEDEEAIGELANSIARDGLLENLVVRTSPTDHGSGFDISVPMHRLVAGERRHRAIGKLIADGRWPADRKLVCKVVDIDDAAHRRIALVENLQRKDLRPMDEARALKGLIDLTGMGTAEVAADIGFTQRYVQQRLQFLDLSEKMQARLNIGDLGIKEARIVAAIWDRLPPIKCAELEAGKTTPDEAKAWLDMQPTPLGLAAKLALCEFMKKSEAEPFKANSYSTERATQITAETVRTEVPDSHTKVNVAVIEDAALRELIRRGIFDEPNYQTTEGVETGRHYVQRRWYSDAAVKEACPAALDPTARDQTIVELRVQLHGLKADFELTASGRYATAWLNVEAKDVAPEVQAQIDAKLAARAEASARQQVERAQEDESRAAIRQSHLDRLNHIKAAESQISKGEDPTGAAGDLAAETGLPLPWYMNEKDGRILASNGQTVEDDYLYPHQAQEFAARRLMVALANASGGVVSPDQAPRAMDPDAMSRDDFVRFVVGCLLDDCDDLPEDNVAAAIVAENRAERGLQWLLDDQEIEYGEADFDWSDAGAMELAREIRENRSGQPEEAEQPDLEDALAGPGAEAEAGQ